jgi:hypothetical protein
MVTGRVYVFVPEVVTTWPCTATCHPRGYRKLKLNVVSLYFAVAMGPAVAVGAGCPDEEPHPTISRPRARIENNSLYNRASEAYVNR